MIRRVAADGRIDTGGAFIPILRPRVVDRIASAATQRIVLIVAPAGYGKSVALRQYLEALHGVPNVRYDVQAENGTLLGFVRGFADAVIGIAPAARKTLPGAYERSRSSKTPGVDLAMWMHAHIKTFTGLVVIDDLHVAENDPEISKFLVSLIERTKGRARWIIASRSSLDLPVGSWLAYGEMDLNIDEQDLRFTIDEARDAAKAAHVAVRDQELSEILGMTEGWPTAMSFALRTSTRSIDLRNIAASTREMVYRYLAEQVYQSLEEEQRQLLHFLAYLPEIDLEVIRTAGYARPKAVIEDLRERVSFIYPERPGVYRCHDLFRAFLQHQVELEGLSAAEAIVRRAGAALESAGRIASALSVYAQARASDEILRVLESTGFALLEQGHADAVQAALDALPQDVRATHAIVLAMRGLSESHAGRFDRAESLLGRALSRTGDPQLRAAFAVRLALIEINLGKDVTALLESVALDGLPVEFQGEIRSLLAIAYANAKREDAAKTAIASAARLAESIDEAAERAKVFQRLGVAAMNLAMPAATAQEYLTRAVTLANECGTFGVAARSYGALSNVSLFYEDDMTRSAWYAQQGMGAATKAGDRLALQTSLLQLIEVELMRGNPERLVALERQFADVSTSDTTRMALIVPPRAVMAAWDGRFADAHRLLAGVLDRIVYAWDRAYMSSVCAISLIVDGQRERGLALIGQVVDMGTPEAPFVRAQRMMEISRLLCAAGEALAGRSTNASRIVNRSRGDAPVIEAVREAVLMLARAVKNRSLRDEVFERAQTLQTMGYGGIAKLLQALAERQLVDDEAPETILTKTELAVLQALAEGRGPKDIALESGRSVYTIQAHIQNVIKKLGCSGRNEALTMARRRGLIG
jgi:ATP/maltotriose-dependent transcriptional regulator MalT